MCVYTSSFPGIRRRCLDSEPRPAAAPTPHAGTEPGMEVSSSLVSDAKVPILIAGCDAFPMTTESVHEEEAVDSTCRWEVVAMEVLLLFRWEVVDIDVLLLSRWEFSDM